VLEVVPCESTKGDLEGVDLFRGIGGFWEGLEGDLEVIFCESTEGTLGVLGGVLEGGEVV